jgi:hypothetical protein
MVSTIEETAEKRNISLRLRGKWRAVLDSRSWEIERTL